MRCKTCDYPLWNLKGRQCPECGTAFLPSEFDFVINSVKFCCPKCEQQYFGTSERGHLLPASFNCVNCQTPITMDSMVLRPAEGVREEQTQINRMPWLERKQRGWFKAWLATVRDSMIRPTALISSVPPETGLGTAWGYALLTVFILLMFGVGLPLGAISGVMALSGDTDAIEPLLGGVFGVAGGVVSLLLFAGVWAASAHGILRLTGKTNASIGRTCECFLYSIGTLAPIAVPCVGPYCGGWFMWIYWLVIAAIMLMVAQGVSGVRAAFATLALPIVVGLIVAIAYVLVIVAAIGSSRGAFSTQFVHGEVATLHQQIMAHAITNNGNGPTHAVELIRPGFSAASFTSSMTATDASNITIGQTTLDQFDLLPTNRLAMAQQAVAAAQPANVIAHRCGDFVFTYHGIDLNNADPSLWVVVYSPDPDLNSTALPSSTSIPVATIGGITQIMAPAFPQNLILQNQNRAQYNLPPLPSPSTITHAQPAVAGPALNTDDPAP